MAGPRGRSSTSGSMAGISRIEQLKHGGPISYADSWNLPRISTVRNAKNGFNNMRPSNTGGDPLRTVDPRAGRVASQQNSQKFGGQNLMGGTDVII